MMRCSNITRSRPLGSAVTVRDEADFAADVGRLSRRVGVGTYQHQPTERRVTKNTILFIYLFIYFSAQLGTQFPRAVNIEKK